MGNLELSLFSLWNIYHKNSRKVPVSWSWAIKKNRFKKKINVTKKQPKEMSNSSVLVLHQNMIFFFWKLFFHQIQKLYSYQNRNIWKKNNCHNRSSNQTDAILRYLVHLANVCLRTCNAWITSAMSFCVTYW